MCLDMDCLHDIDAPIAISHAILPSTCFYLPTIYDDCDVSDVE